MMPFYPNIISRFAEIFQQKHLSFQKHFALFPGLPYPYLDYIYVYELNSSPVFGVLTISLDLFVTRSKFNNIRLAEQYYFQNTKLKTMLIVSLL